MKYELLTGDNIEGIGRTLSDILSSMGIDVIRCSNSFPVLEESCTVHEPDALIFFITAVCDEIFDFVRKMRDKFPKLKMFVLSYVKSIGLRQRLEDAGITNYFLMPELLTMMTVKLYPCIAYEL